MSDIYDLKLPAQMALVMAHIMDKAKKNEVLTIRFRHSKRGDYYSIDAGDEPDEIREFKRDVLLALQELGFVRILEEEDIKRMTPGIILLRERAYTWEYYQQRGAVGKWWEQAKQAGKDAAPLILSIAALILTLLQILQALGIL